MIRYFLLLILISSTASAADIPTQFSFAQSLVAEGESYRAITEFKRFIFLYPDSPLVPRARLLIARNQLAGQKWSKADASIEDLLRLHPLSPEAEEARQLYADSAYQRGRFGLARERYRRLLESTTKPEVIDYANFKIGWTFLEQDRPQQSLNSFHQLPASQRNQLQADLENYLKLPLKSPLVAGSLSTLLPGLGQAYTGRYQQAVVAFLLNGAFILGAIDSFHQENYAVGGILSFFEIGWYGGNIYNAVNNAHKHNRRLKHRYQQQMRSRLSLKLGFMEKKPTLKLAYKF